MADSFNTRRRRWCHKLATDKRLTPTQRLIGILLAEMTRPERQSCNPSRKWIAKQIGCKPGAVTRAVRKLKDHEYLTVPIKGNISPHFSNPLAICQVEPMSSGRGGVWVTSRWSGPGLIV